MATIQDFIMGIIDKYKKSISIGDYLAIKDSIKELQDLYINSNEQNIATQDRNRLLREELDGRESMSFTERLKELFK